MKKITFLFTLFVTVSLLSQVKGNISDKKGEPLSFVSVYLDKTVTGTTSNDNGDYVLNIKKSGKHTVVFQILGYKTVKKTIDVTSFPFELNVTLEEENVQLDEISISTKDNPANRIIRNVIANKDKNTDKFAKYTAKFYSRGLYRIKDAPEKFMGQSTGDFGGGLDSTRSGIIYLSETVSEIHFQKKPKKFKEKIIASKVSGEDNGISFNEAKEVDFNFYLKGDDGQEYTLKISRTGTPLEEIDFQIALLKHLSQSEIPLEVPRSILTKEGKDYIQLDQQQFIRLQQRRQRPHRQLNFGRRAWAGRRMQYHEHRISHVQLHVC